MFDLQERASFATKTQLYEHLLAQLSSVFEGERDFIANAANTSALLYHTLPSINWAGFYLYKGGELVLGPFQGRPACVRIAMGKGVCGTAAADSRTIIVEDVNTFPGHITCDSASNSEIVVPLIAEGRLLGVLDIDSPVRGRFDTEDQAGLEAIVEKFLALTDLRSGM